MLRTIILDSYMEREKKEIMQALDMLCNAQDNYGWSSAGIYCYWNYYTQEILYIGLAVDLLERFKQHNGFVPGIDLRACKKEQIDDYFRHYDRIGFSIIVQSPLSQPSTAKVQQRFSGLFEKEERLIELGMDGKNQIQRLEGVLIESFKKVNSTFPSWNKIGGSFAGQQAVRASNEVALKVLANHTDHYLKARSSLREIAKSATLERYENFLHAARMIAPMIGLERALEVLDAQDPLGTLGHIIKAEYLQKVPVI